MLLTQEKDPENELEWQRDALCSQTDPEAFFPDQERGGGDAKKICKLCPVKQDCFDYAVSNNERNGIWGGIDFTVRRSLIEEKNDNGYESQGTRSFTLRASEFKRLAKEGRSI
jgi:hypothetical protein